MRICNYYVGNETVFAVTAEEQAAVIRDAVVAAAGPDQDIVDETWHLWGQHEDISDDQQ